MAFSGREKEFLELTIDNDGFYPALSVGEFQKVFRVPAELAPEAVEHQLTLAVSEINLQLQAHRIAQWQSFNTLEDVNASYRIYYNEAVFARAKALLINDFETFSRKTDAANTAESSSDVYQDLVNRSYHAVHRLMGEKVSINVALL